jgi:hypothetical protein
MTLMYAMWFDDHMHVCILQVKAWRRHLHKFDDMEAPKPAAGGSNAADATEMQVSCAVLAAQVLVSMKADIVYAVYSYKAAL